MNKQESEMAKEKEVKELVLARISVMPPNYKLSVGNKGTFTKEEIINHIKERDEIGNQIIGIEMNFIKALTSGKLLETLNR
ncbi:hypothetical protein COU57_01885 [Candidatus Pacearchaeota archaeon CG10_big_fil_rev_8_21_14_0_10_32_14]|nr:MAG: hypothetical protein COU57_01885 [Candidatus Pacearchaeota archaeon CG10_big_fil_rev_8_21_14_0_10_32_14]